MARLTEARAAPPLKNPTGAQTRLEHCGLEGAGVRYRSINAGIAV
jgi:hypothetical protein